MSLHRTVPFFSHRTARSVDNTGPSGGPVAARQQGRRRGLGAGAAVAFCAGTAAMAATITAPPGEVMALHDIAAATSADRIHDDVRTLVNFGTRHTASETDSDTRGIGAARRWIFAEFEKISAGCGGCLEVIYVGETISGERRIPDPVEVISVLAIQRGALDPNRMVLMSGDIDSRVSDPLNAISDSPGANDNASGMAGVLEAARVLSAIASPVRSSTPVLPARSRGSSAGASSRSRPRAGLGDQGRTQQRHDLEYFGHRRRHR
jgi:hypothetical protein